MGLVTFGDIFYILYFLETYLNHDRYLPSHTLNLTTTTDPEVNQLGKLSSVNFSLRRVPEGSLSQTHTHYALRLVISSMRTTGQAAQLSVESCSTALSTLLSSESH